MAEFALNLPPDSFIEQMMREHSLTSTAFVVPLASKSIESLASYRKKAK